MLCGYGRDGASDFLFFLVILGGDFPRSIRILAFALRVILVDGAGAMVASEKLSALRRVATTVGGIDFVAVRHELEDRIILAVCLCKQKSL